MFSYLYITPQHYSMPIPFIAISLREENVWKGKAGGQRKSAKERQSFSPLATEMSCFVMDQWPLIAM